MSSPLYILDGYALIYKAYYSLGNKPALRNDKQENITAIMMFFRSLFLLIKTYHIEYLVVALDPKETNFRKEIYPDYKANRQETPDELHSQANHIERILHESGIKVLRIKNNEADDIIASIASQRQATDQESIIISGDKDLMQLINKNIRMLRFTSKTEFKAGVEAISTPDVINKMGVPPEQIRDYLSIVGDASDNIPGILGIGPKGAIKLLKEYQSLEKIYENIDHIKPESIKNKLLANKENAFLSWNLIKLKIDIDITDINNNHYTLKNVKFSSIAANLHLIGIKQVAVEATKLAEQFEHKSDFDINDNLDKSHLPRKNFTYHVVNNIKDVKSLFIQLEEAKIFSFDSETTGLDPHKDSIVGISFSMNHEHGYYLPFKAPLTEKILSIQEVVPLLHNLFSNPSIKIIGQNLKFDYQFLQQLNIEMNPYFDTMIAGWLINSDSPVNLDALSIKYLQCSTISYQDIVPKNHCFSDVPLNIGAEYACEDAVLTFALHDILIKILRENHLENLFFTVEMPMLTILANMEFRGIYIDEKELSELGSSLYLHIQNLEANIISLAGKSFNIQSPKQLAEILYTHMKFPNLKKGSTDIHTIVELQRLYPTESILNLIIEYRKLTKLNSTYVEGLLKERYEDGSIRTNFMQTGTASGRLSSNHPNLQNIPIKDPLGRKIRSTFKARPNYFLLSADYSQIELVVLASLSKDDTMLAIFKEKRDLHKETASFLFSTPLDLITAEQRRTGKIINFGVIYGMSAFRLSNELGITRNLASQFIHSYFTRYEKINLFIKEAIVYAQKNGEVRTILNRRRLIPLINSSNHNERSAGERMALNTIIQGSAADIVKIAMINTHQVLKKHGIDAHLLLQVHDELVLEVHHEAIEKTKKLVHKTMTEAARQLPIPMNLDVNIEIGKNWGEFH